MSSSITVEPFRCSRLGRVAFVEIERNYDPHYPDPSNRPDDVEWRQILVSLVDCRNRHQCGIMQRNSVGTWDIKWELCPAKTVYDKT